MFTHSVGTPLHSHSGVHAALQACTYVSPTPTPTIPAGLQLCFHFGHVPSTGPLVCSYSQQARCCNPLYADSSMGPLVCSNPPPTPSQWAHSYVSISYKHLPQAHLLNTFLPLFSHLGPHMYMKINGIQSPGPLKGDCIHHEIVKMG